MTKQLHYWETQEKRWYEQYLESEKMVSELETALINVEAIALNHIMDDEVRKSIEHLVDAVWRGARK